MPQQPAHSGQQRGLAAAWRRWTGRLSHPAPWIAGALCVLTLIADLMTSQGVTVAIAYGPFVICGLWFARPLSTYLFAGVATALTILVLFVKPPSDIALWVIVVNRALAIGAIWTVAALVRLRRRSDTAFRQTQSRLHEAVNDVAEAQEKMALLAAVVESSGDAVFTKSRDGKIMSWNAGAERLLGYDADEAIGRSDDLIVPADCTDEQSLINAEILEGRTIENFETVYVRKDGERRHVSLTVSPIRDAEGAIVGTSKVARDITARKAAEADLLRHTLALERSNKDLDDFAYIASHDLREPLRGLANNAKFLQDDYEEKLDRNGINRLHRMGYLTKRMDQLINDLLYFSRLGRQDLAIVPVDLNAVVADVASTMSLDDQNGKIVLPRALPTIVCDKPRVTEMLRNLIGNALKYNNSAEKRVEIGYIAELATARGLETQVFYVRDNGIGIEKEFHDEVFRIFKRLNEEDDAKKGTGVGLTVVRKIVERHGGRIWVDSRPGAGTTFYFTLAEGSAHAAA